MKEDLIAFIKKLKDEMNVILDYDEAAVKQVVILKILSLLGWDIFDLQEVKPEHSVGGGAVDYSLRHGNTNKTFVEVKRAGEELEKHQEQLLNYSFQQGVPLAVLTNGITWWLYLPLKEGNWEHRRFYTVDIKEQQSEEIVDRFVKFLSKENIASGNAVRHAEETYTTQARQAEIRDALPKAWNRIVSEPDSTLVVLIAETVEKLCGHKPDDEAVKKFMSRHHGR